MKKLLVLTTPYFFPDEGLIISRLFEEGLERLHLRKPGCTVEELTALISSIPLINYPRIILHDQFSIAVERHLGGVHLNKRNPVPPDNFTGSISRSCHSLQDVEQSRHCDYVFLSPLFDSISKEGYRQAFSMEELAAASSSGIINEKVFALGGIDATTLPLLKNLPFGGVAVLGSIWGKEISIDNFSTIIMHLKQIQYVLRSL